MVPKIIFLLTKSFSILVVLVIFKSKNLASNINIIRIILVNVEVKSIE